MVRKLNFQNLGGILLRLNETKAFFLFFVDVTDFHAIQKKRLTDGNELNDFRTFIEEKHQGS